MFKPIHNGKCVTVYGLKCWIPPVGFGYHSDPDQARMIEAKTGLAQPLLERVDVIKRSTKKEEQYWERPDIPAEVNEWFEEERDRQLTEPEWQHPELAKISQREWHRRRYGVWFYNNGVPEYITGPNYYFLTYWAMNSDTGYPDFRKIDQEYFYFWAYCYEDPKCYGMNDIEKRRNGKTEKAACIAVEIITRTAKSHAYIQSKTEADANDLFDLKLIPAFRAMPPYFKPEYDRAKGDVPKGNIRFFKTSKKGKIDPKLQKVPELQSSINAKESGAKAIDGLRSKIYIGDESGKTKVDMLDRHKVVQRCCKNQKGEIIGKMIITTTVEEVGFKYKFDKLWAQSNQFERQKDGSTKSGLYKLFTPAHRSMDYDIYGYPKEQEAIDAINAEREKFKDSVEELNDVIRKEPMTEEEAFFVDAKQCHFNPNSLNFRLSDLSLLKNYKERGNFSWANGERDTKVIWTPDPTGRWEICWLFDKPGQSNKVERRGNRYMPLNGLRFITGCDPFDHDQVEDTNQRSKGCAFTLKRHDPNAENDPYNKAFICKYLYRHELAYSFYEDMIMQCFYFGSPLLFENNKGGIARYFELRGYKDFLIHYSDRKEAGIPASTENKVMMLEIMQEFFKEHIDKQFFPDLIQDLLKFEIANTQKYDLSMAAGWTLFADHYNVAAKGSTGLKDVTKLFRRYAA
ncbi:hypothetical protein PDL71_15455 [Lacibacter sp. MH-610]|uniref:hypothetical protein n=1 Tax=Lacibacter sp. MH-610 TaxID=3020883 RepID=UPI003891E47D